MSFFLTDVAELEVFLKFYATTAYAEVLTNESITNLIVSVGPAIEGNLSR